MMNKLFLFTLMPKFSAYKSPNNKTFIFLDKNRLANKPAIIATEKNVNLLVPTAENVPIPQITKA